jgi:hypothetical protein
MQSTSSAARRHLSSVTSSSVPWISTRSSAWLATSIAGSSISLTSFSLFRLPVMKLTALRAWLGAVADAIVCDDAIWRDGKQIGKLKVLESPRNWVFGKVSYSII